MVFPASIVVTFWYFLLIDQMEAIDIPKNFKQLWNKWDIRILILLSLFIQVILIFIGRLRKTSASIKIQMCLWSSYLLADWVADFALGRLSGKMDGSSSSSNAITAFWSPFLILHLGGPDTITAYSLEDNELWLRHLIALCYELIAAFYVFFLSLPNAHLLAPTLLIFFVGIIKYVERSYSLYKASTKSFRRSVLFAYKSLNISSSSTKSEKHDLVTLYNCFSLYNAFKPSFVDVEIRPENLNQARRFLKPLKRKELLEVLDLELSFAYDELYTKAIVNHSRAGYVLRALCSICIWLAFFLYVLAPKVSFNKVDMAITHVLLATSIFLDTMAIVMLVFSDWMVISLLKNKMLGHWAQLLAMHIFKIRIRWLKRRCWSREMPQLNLISNFLKNFEKKEAPWRSMMNWIKEKLSLVQKTYLFPGSLETTEVFTLRALQPIKATQELQEIIVEHAQSLLGLSFTCMEVDLVSSLKMEITSHDIKEFFRNMNKLSLERVVFTCHIATELCIHSKSEHPQIATRTEDSTSGGVNGKTLEKDACMYLSNYMMHMVVMRPEMMSTMGGSKSTIFWADYHRIFMFFKNRGIDDQLLIPNAKVEDVCRKIMESDFDTNYYTLKKAQTLARMLLDIEEEQRWQLVTKIWVMLLIKGAKLSKASMHLKQLSKGGEPFTLTWLFTKHNDLGLDDVLS